MDYIANHVQVGDPLPTEMRMAELGETSRTAVRSTLGYFVARGLIGGMKERYLLRKPVPQDYFDVSELHSSAESLQEVFMERIYHGDLPPGAAFSEAELTRASGASTTAVREFLIGFSRHGLIQKTPGSGWRLCVFDPAYAEELAEAREMFELRAIERVARLDPADPPFKRFEALLERHRALAKMASLGRADFPSLDREFHSLLIGLLNNRFAQALNDAVSMVFHYHYQWNKQDELPRNRYALQEHIAILEALVARNVPAALDAMRTHLQSARSTMHKAIDSRARKTGGHSD